MILKWIKKKIFLRDNQSSLTNENLSKYIETFRKNSKPLDFLTIDGFGKMLSSNNVGSNNTKIIII